VGTIFGVFIGFKLIVLFCPCFTFINDNCLKEAIYVLFREVVIALLCMVILEGLFYSEILTFNYYQDPTGNLVIVGDHSNYFPSLNMGGTTYCILLALFMYTLLGFLLCVIAQK